MCAAASKSSAVRRPAAPRWTPERSRGSRRYHSGPRVSAITSASERPRVAPRRATPTPQARLRRRRYRQAERAAAPHTKKKMGRTTAADKKKMLLKIYHTKKEPFNLKELTKLAKAAGLAEKLVQDVNTC